VRGTATNGDALISGIIKRSPSMRMPRGEEIIRGSLVQTEVVPSLSTAASRCETGAEATKTARSRGVKATSGLIARSAV